VLSCARLVALHPLVMVQSLWSFGASAWISHVWECAIWTIGLVTRLVRTLRQSVSISMIASSRISLTAVQDPCRGCSWRVSSQTIVRGDGLVVSFSRSWVWCSPSLLRWLCDPGARAGMMLPGRSRETLSAQSRCTGRKRVSRSIAVNQGKPTVVPVRMLVAGTERVVSATIRSRRHDRRCRSCRRTLLGWFLGRACWCGLASGAKSSGLRGSASSWCWCRMVCCRC
jgi:hypothetical protein